MALAGLGAVLFLGVYEAGVTCDRPRRSSNAGIKPNAATVQPLSASEHRAVLYGPAPVRLAGKPDFYVVPSGKPAVFGAMIPIATKWSRSGELPPFSSVQAIRLIARAACWRS